MIIPAKLKKGDEIRIISPSRSLSLISEEVIRIAEETLKKEGFKVTFSKNSREMDEFLSSSINSRVQDLHEAFADKDVKAILTAIGGFNSNQLLKHIDFELIRKNPKIICGYSDITALTNAITAKTRLVTYSGPHFSTFGMIEESEYNLEQFKRCLVDNDEFEVRPSKTWSDDKWYEDQEDRTLSPNKGPIIINKGFAEGRIIGGNLGTLCLLFGTAFMPDIRETILFIEECYGGEESFAEEFDRNLQSLIQQPGFDKVKGMVIGRFQKDSRMTSEKLKLIIKGKDELKDIPIIADANFGHTNPIITFPIGGTARLEADTDIELKILKH